MKKTKKFLSIVCALCMIMAMAAPAFAANDPTTRHMPRTISVEEFMAIEPRTTLTGRVKLPKMNQDGTNGNSCAQFTADETDVSFVITEAPNTSTYNVQLYQGTISGGGSQVFIHEKDVNVGAGASFPDLTIGETYFFKVSSEDCPADGSNAKWTVKTFS